MGHQVQELFAPTQRLPLLGRPTELGPQTAVHKKARPVLFPAIDLGVGADDVVAAPTKAALRCPCLGTGPVQRSQAPSNAKPAVPAGPTPPGTAGTAGTAKDQPRQQQQRLPRQHPHPQWFWHQQRKPGPTG